MLLSMLSALPASLLLVLVARVRADHELPRFKDLKSSYTLGERYNIMWEPDNGEETTLWLYSGSSTWTQIAEETTDSFFEWNVVEDDFIKARDYWLVLRQARRGIELDALIQLVSKEEEDGVETSVVGDVITKLESSERSTATTETTTATDSAQSSSATATSTTMSTTTGASSTGSGTASVTTGPTSTPTETSKSEVEEKKGLSNGAKAGVGVATVMGVGLLAAGAFFLVTFLRRKRWSAVPARDKNGWDEPELVGRTS